MTSTQGRALVTIVALVILVLVISLATGKLGKHASLVTSNQLSSEKLDDLKRKAAMGDASAQYALTLYIDDPIQSGQLLKSAAEAGFPPTVVTFAQTLMSKGGGEAERAKVMLEGAALRGYVPAITELVHCLDVGECGKPAKIAAYTWIVVAELLAQQGKIESGQLGEESKRLRPQLTQREFEEAQESAKAIVERARSAV